MLRTLFFAAASRCALACEQWCAPKCSTERCQLPECQDCFAAGNGRSCSDWCAPKCRTEQCSHPECVGCLATTVVSSRRCGTTWDTANSACGPSCPDQTDAECAAGEHCWSDLSLDPCNPATAASATAGDWWDVMPPAELDSATTTAVLAANSGNADGWQVLPPHVGTVTPRDEGGSYVYHGELCLLGGRGSLPIDCFNPVTRAWRSSVTKTEDVHHVQPVVFRHEVSCRGRGCPFPRELLRGALGGRRD